MSFASKIQKCPVVSKIPYFRLIQIIAYETGLGKSI